MRFATTLSPSGERQAALVHPRRGVASIASLLPGFAGDLLDLIRSGAAPDARDAAEAADDTVFAAADSLRFAAPYLHPRMIWGIGLNYRDHAEDLSESVPEEPASFIKADHTIVGPQDPIVLPHQSARVTAEAEVGLVIGRHCRDVDEHEALDYVFGLVPVLDQTAEDILQRNPRFLTRAKNFPGFFSFGPHIATIDEIAPDGLGSLEVSTVLNGRVLRSNRVGNMTFSPQQLVSFHSEVMPLEPGDIISTGTPGAVVISSGDVAECRIPGFPSLRNPVSSSRS